MHYLLYLLIMLVIIYDQAYCGANSYWSEKWKSLMHKDMLILSGSDSQ